MLASRYPVAKTQYTQHKQKMILERKNRSKYDLQHASWSIPTKLISCFVNKLTRWQRYHDRSEMILLSVRTKIIVIDPCKPSLLLIFSLVYTMYLPWLFIKEITYTSPFFVLYRAPTSKHCISS